MTSTPTLTSLPPRTSSSSSSSMASASPKRITTTRTRSLSGSPKSKQRRTRTSLAVRPVHILPDLEEEDEEQLVGSGPSSPLPIKPSSSYLDMMASAEESCVTEEEETLMRKSKRASRTRSIGLSGLKDLAQGVEVLLGEHESRATGISTRSSFISENIDRAQQKAERRDKVSSSFSSISDDEDGDGVNAFSTSTLLTIDGLSLAFPSPPSSTSSTFSSPRSSSSSPLPFTSAHILNTPTAVTPQRKISLELEQMFNPRASSPTLSMLSVASAASSRSSSSSSVSTSPTPSTPHLSDASEDDDSVVAIVEDKDRDELSNSHIAALPELKLGDVSKYTTRNVNVNSMAARKRPVPLVAPLVIAKRAIADNSVAISTSTSNSDSISTSHSRPTTTLTRTNTTASMRSARRYVERESVKQMFAPLDRVADEMGRFDLESVWERIVRREEGEVMRIEKEKQREMVRSFTAIVEEKEEEAQWVDVIDDYSISHDDENVDDEEDAIEFYRNDLGSHLEILQGAMMSPSPRGSFSKSYKKGRRSSMTSMTSAVSSTGSFSSSSTSSSSHSILSTQVPRTPRTPKTPKAPLTPLTPHSVSSLRRQKSLGHRHAANAAAAAAAAAARRKKRAWLHERERERRATMLRSNSSTGGSDVLPPVPAVPTAVIRDIKVNRPPPRMEVPCDIFDDGEEDLGEVYEQFDDPFAAYNVQEVVYQPKQIMNTYDASAAILRRPRRELPDVPVPVSPLTPVTPATPAKEEENDIPPRPVNVPKKVYPDPHPKKLGLSTKMRTKVNANANTTPIPPVPPMPPMPSPQVMAKMIQGRQNVLIDNSDTAPFDESRVLRSRWSSSTLSTLADNPNGEKNSMLSGFTKGKFSWFGEKKDDKTSANSTASGKSTGKGTKKQKPNLPPVIVNSQEKIEYASFFEPMNTATSVSLKRTSSEKGPISPKMYATHRHVHSHSQSGVLYSAGINYFKAPQQMQTYSRRHDVSRLPTTPSPHSSSSSPTSSSSPATPSPTHAPSPSSPLFSPSGKTIRRSLSRSSSTASEFSSSSAGSEESSGRRRKPIPVEIFMRA